MGQKPWSTSSQSRPPVSWNGNSKTFSIVLSGSEGAGVEAEWTPPITYVVRIREANTGEWSIGFETPLTGCSFVGLKPDTEYEVEVRSKNDQGESSPVTATVRATEEGSVGI